MMIAFKQALIGDAACAAKPRETSQAPHRLASLTRSFLTAMPMRACSQAKIMCKGVLHKTRNLRTNGSRFIRDRCLAFGVVIIATWLWPVIKKMKNAGWFRRQSRHYSLHTKTYILHTHGAH